MKPKVFIGSSVEQLELAYAVQEELEHSAEATVWTQGAFKLSQSSMANLLDIISEADFGIFVFAPDDVTKLREAEIHTVRDNVVFELGLFIGRLGAERSFLIVPVDSDLHLPTDLLGITPATFEPGRQDGNMRAALGPACNRTRRAITRLGGFKAIAEGQLLTAEAEKVGRISDEGDILALLQSWMDNRSSSENAAVIRFVDVDRDLGLPPGSAKQYIKRVAQRWGYEVAHKGEQTILFQEARRSALY